MDTEEAPVVDYNGGDKALPETNNETTPEPSLRDQLKAASEEIKAREEKPDRTRDDKGRFSAKTEDPKTPEPAKEAQKVEEPKPEVKDIAPASWSDASKALWATLPPDVKAAITKREAEIHQGLTKHDGDLNLGRQVKEIANKFGDTVQAVGMSLPQVMESYLAIEHTLRTGTPEQKKKVLIDAAQAYGIDLGTQKTPTSDEYTDPALQPLLEKIASLEGEVSELRGHRQQQTLDVHKSQVEAFAADPKNKHFEAVCKDMLHNIRAQKAAGLKPDLQKAYDDACWVNPEVRSSLLKEQEDKRLAETKAKADAARNASSTVTGAPGATMPAKPDVSKRSLREELQANFRSVQNA